MTAVNVVIQSDRAHILSDGAGIDAEGVVRQIFSKVLIFPHLRAAIAFRGSAAMKMIVGFNMDGCGIAPGCFDDLYDKLPRIFRQVHDYGKTQLAQSPNGDSVEIFIIGWSETRGPTGGLVASHETYGEPWIMHPMQGVNACPCDKTLSRELVKIWPPDKAVAEFDPHRHGVQMLEVQRNYAVPYAGREIRSVGGFAMLTTVTKYGINSAIMKKWPDKIGEPISP